MVMKKNILGIAAVTFSLVMTGCEFFTEVVHGSGDVVTESKLISGFTKVDISDGCNVELKKSDTYSVQIVTDDNIQGYIETYRSNSTLYVGFKRTFYCHPTKFKAIIYSPEITSIDASGGTDIKISGFLGDDDGNVDLSGGSSLSGDFSCDDITISLSGGSECELQGDARDLNLEESGGSKAILSSFITASCNASLSGGSTAHIKTNGVISGSLSGGSVIYYTGSATLGNCDKSGGSKVIAE